MKDHTYTPNVPDTTGWKQRHLEAMALPLGTLKSPAKCQSERAVVLMVRGWLEYAESHKAAYQSNIGDDYVLRDEWYKIGEALLGLLNGNIGRLDAGTLDEIIRDNLIEQGFDPERGERATFEVKDCEDCGTYCARCGTKFDHPLSVENKLNDLGDYGWTIHEGEILCDSCDENP